MKRKLVAFLIAFIIYGTLFGFFRYYAKLDQDFYSALKAGTFFGVFMGLCEVFVNPWIKRKFSNKK